MSTKSPALETPRSRSRRLKAARRWVRYRAALVTVELAARSPRSFSLAGFAAAGRLAHPIMPRQRRLVRAEIDRVFPDRPASFRRALERAAFVELGRSVADVARLWRPSAARELLSHVSVPDERRLEPLLSGRGAIAVGAHLGAWELVPPILATLGARVVTLVRPVREERLDRILTRLRRACGVEVLPRPQDARACLSVLRGGGVLAVAIDQRPRGRSVGGRLLGVPVELPAGPALLSRAAGVPLVPVSLVRRGRRHELVVGAPIPPASRTEGEEALRRGTIAAAEVLGEWIASAPAQWAWFHARFARA